MVNVPDRIGRYQVRGVLGSGGFATVYRAYDAALERELALKVLHPHLATDPALRERFLREGRALARIDHPNIVTVWEAGEEGGTAFLAMKLITGRPLSDILATTGPLPAGQVATIIEQVAAALGAVHARNLVHRDIKPDNIMIEDGSNRAMLLDLGVARDLANATMTGGLIVGTLGYMAPEQAQASGDVTPRADVYQLGATAFALLTGRPPFGGDTIQVLDAVIRHPPPDLRAIRPDVPEGAIAAIARAMAKTSSFRPSTASAFAAEMVTGMTPQPLRPPTPGATWTAGPQYLSSSLPNLRPAQPAPPPPTTGGAGTARFCGSCGMPLAGARFCPRCGTSTQANGTPGVAAGIHTPAPQHMPVPSMEHEIWVGSPVAGLDPLVNPGTTYVLTTTRLLIFQGVVIRTSVAIALSLVQDIQVRRRGRQKAANAGDIIIKQVASPGAAPLTETRLMSVYDPDVVAGLIRNVVQSLGRRK